jgi:hypothetical protein
MVIALGILFVVGRMLMRQYLLPAPLPKLPPSGALPWSRTREESQHENTIMNDVPFALMTPKDSPFPPGNGEFAPVPENTPQPVPFNGPFGPGNASQQQVSFNGPFWPSNSGFAPANVAQEPFPPTDWFAPPD